MDFLAWLSKWFENFCDGDWERSNLIDIHTVDNPGWSMKIDLEGTPLENYEFDSGLVEISTHDWFRFSFKKGLYQAAGDPKKLKFLLEKFRETAERFDQKK